MLSFFPRDVLDGIWDLIGSVSEGFPTYFFKIKGTRESVEPMDASQRRAIMECVAW